MVVVSGTIEAVDCCAAIMLAMALGYLVGSRRQPPHLGAVQVHQPRHRR
jgi:hypothetical protein